MNDDGDDLRSNMPPALVVALMAIVLWVCGGFVIWAVWRLMQGAS